MKHLKLIMASALTLFSVGVSAALFFEGAPPVTVEEKIARSKMEIEYLDDYIKHLDYVMEKTTHSAKFTSIPNFYQNNSLIIGSGTCGGTGITGYTGAYSGMATMGTTFGGTSPIIGPCECPKGNRDMECLLSIKTTIKHDPIDVAGYTFYGIWAEQNMDFVVLNEKNQWIPIEEAANGVYTYAIPVNKPIESFDTKSNFKNICKTFPRGDVNIYMAYGTSEPKELEYIRYVKTLEPGFDEIEHIWYRAVHTAMNQNKYALIATATCGNKYGQIGYSY